MTPKQKAIELIDKIIKEGADGNGFDKRNICFDKSDAARFALIAAEEVVKIHIEYHPPLVSEYWRKVKDELENLI